MKIALTLPWSETPTITIRPDYTPTNNAFPATSFQLAQAINIFGEVALYVGGFLMFFWAAWGVFDYIRAEGNKEALAKARKRIQWAIAGFVILVISFFISDFVAAILSQGVGVGSFRPPQLTDPKIP